MKSIADDSNHLIGMRDGRKIQGLASHAALQRRDMEFERRKDNNTLQLVAKALFAE